MKLAAIDIGSNAGRLLITEVSNYKDGTQDYTKINLVRVPLRLGFDVFDTGFISDKKIKELLETLKAYKHLMNVYNVLHYKAVATSALRDAKNNATIKALIKAETGVDLQIITGDEEANIIYENQYAQQLSKANYHLYIDVGGGSTELTLFGNNEIIVKKSFNVGTIRLLSNKVSEEVWNEMKAFVKLHAKKINTIDAIGSGGNINKIFSLSKKKEGKALSYELINDYYKQLNALTVDERIHLFNLKEDRADVIVPALLIYTCVMRWANINDIYVPQIGLADGLIKVLYKEVVGK